MHLNDPVDKDSVPTVGDESRAATGDRFTPTPLSPAMIASLKQSLERNQLRRRAYRASRLRVCIDGEARWQFDPRVGVYGSFRVPLRASHLEISGDDTEGNLLLALFPLPGPAWAEDDGAQHLSVTLEGGQTVAIEIAPGYGTRQQVSEYVIQISYVEAVLTSPCRASGDRSSPKADSPP